MCLARILSSVNVKLMALKKTHTERRMHWQIYVFLSLSRHRSTTVSSQESLSSPKKVICDTHAKRNTTQTQTLTTRMSEKDRYERTRVQRRKKKKNCVSFELLALAARQSCHIRFTNGETIEIHKIPALRSSVYEQLTASDLLLDVFGRDRLSTATATAKIITKRKKAN